MIIKVLAANTAASETFAAEHGMSLYVETDHHRLLFDTGASDLFIKNAEKLHVDLAQVDAAMISHGHYDHGGGLHAFLAINDKAPVFAHAKAFAGYYALRSGGQKEYIGLDQTLSSNMRLHLCGDYLRIDDQLTLYADVAPKWFVPASNSNLLMQEGDSFVADDFLHEQYLVISQAGKTLLITGCAHRGIVNIVERAGERLGRRPDYVVGGFHLRHSVVRPGSDACVLTEIAHRLLETGAQYYTGHCTSVDAFHCLKAVMGNYIKYIAAGETITFDM